ncbi:hypothetical protein ACIPPQ_20310 [Sphingopyxis sp. LARHCG72]
MLPEEQLEARLSDLEERLSEYHEHLERSLERDRRFQLDATWGIVSSFVSLCTVAGAIWLLNKTGLDGWEWRISATVVGLIAFIAPAFWIYKQREQDERRLSILPQWDDLQRHVRGK